MCANIINSCGLVADVIGAAVLFYQTTYFEKRLPTDGAMVLHEPNAPLAKQGKRAAALARWGFGLLILGFILQFASDFI